jgi:NADH-quinone oxidoreductase subunit H
VLGLLLILVKAIALIVVIMWVKWTFPRFRSDQLMSMAWKVLTPMAIVQLVIAGVVSVWL